MIKKQIITIDWFVLGAFGNVKYAWLKDNPDAKFAIKAMKKKEIIDSKHVDHIENEKKILEVLEHPFIVSTILCSIFTYRSNLIRYLCLAGLLRIHTR